jgi:FtsP/CotA-like multicopper oxidase with cupredoxin domain
MARVIWERREHEDHIFWVARSGRYSLRIDANKPGVYRWTIQDVNDGNRYVAGDLAPDRAAADEAVRAALAGLA